MDSGLNRKAADRGPGRAEFKLGQMPTFKPAAPPFGLHRAMNHPWQGIRGSKGGGAACGCGSQAEGGGQGTGDRWIQPLIPPGIGLSRRPYNPDRFAAMPFGC